MCCASSDSDEQHQRVSKTMYGESLWWWLMIASSAVVVYEADVWRWNCCASGVEWSGWWVVVDLVSCFSRCLLLLLLRCCSALVELLPLHLASTASA